MPCTRSSMASVAEGIIDVSSDDDDDILYHIATRPKKRRAPRSSAPDSTETAKKRTHGSSALPSTSQGLPDALTENYENSPSSSTRSRLRSESGLVALSFEERCLAELDRLREKYGDDDDGYGVKVTKRPPITNICVTVSLLLDPKIRAFTLVLINNPSRPESFKGLKYFPPLRVQLDVSKNSTNLILSASWLLKKHLKLLTKKVDAVFRKHCGDHAFETALAWLETNGIGIAGIMHGRSVTYVAATVNSSKKKDTQVEFQNLEPIRHLFLTTQYRRATIAKTADLRGVASFNCSICFDHKSVMMASMFTPCSHFFCVNCVRQDFSLKIKENRVRDICCLAEGCHAQAQPDMVKFAVDRDTFQRYCDLSANTFVEGASFIRCPQKTCNAPMELAPDIPREVQCPTCRHKFCKSCNGKPHPKTPCLTDNQKKEIRDSYIKADAKGKEALEKRYGMDNIKFALEDAESVDWIAKNAKPCPKCKTPIQKNDGCNKMVCTAHGCGAYFCWLCGESLKTPNPYLHFQSGKCSGRLHEGQDLNAPPNFNLLNFADGNHPFGAGLNWNNAGHGHPGGHMWHADPDEDDYIDDFEFHGGFFDHNPMDDMDSDDEEEYDNWNMDFNHYDEFEYGDVEGFDPNEEDDEDSDVDEMEWSEVELNEEPLGLDLHVPDEEYDDLLEEDPFDANGFLLDDLYDELNEESGDELDFSDDDDESVDDEEFF